MGPATFALGPFATVSQGFDSTIDSLASINPGTGQIGIVILGLVDTASPAMISFEVTYQIG